MDDLLCLSNFKKFKCKCDKCRHTCCELWHITLSEDEYFRLISLECSKELREKLDKTFSILAHPSEDKYAEVNLNYYGFCPLLDEKGYCSLQKECGAKILPSVCVNYPRVKRKNVNNEIGLSCSCEGVLETLKDGKLYFESYSTKEEFKIIKQNGQTNDLSVREHCFEIMQNSQKVIYDRLIELKDYLEKKQNTNFDMDNIKDTNQIIEYIKSIIRELYKKDYYLSNSEDKVKIAKIKIEDLDKRLFIENVLVNHMFYSNFPYTNKYDDFYSSYLGLYTVYELLINAFFNNNEIIDDNLIDQFSYIFRVVEHTAFYYNCVVIYKSMLPIK